MLRTPESLNWNSLLYYYATFYPRCKARGMQKIDRMCYLNALLKGIGNGQLHLHWITYYSDVVKLIWRLHNEPAGTRPLAGTCSHRNQTLQCHWSSQAVFTLSLSSCALPFCTVILCISAGRCYFLECVRKVTNENKWNKIENKASVVILSNVSRIIIGRPRNRQVEEQKQLGYKIGSSWSADANTFQTSFLGALLLKWLLQLKKKQRKTNPK